MKSPVICLAAATLIAGVVHAQTAPVAAYPNVMKTKLAIDPATLPFPLEDVKLLDGPFLRAMEQNRQYLLSLPPDRLLHDFRLTAGLPSSAEPLGGWEEPKCELRGHFAGHYLSACALMYRAAGDDGLKANADQVVAGLAECQAKFPNGYLSAYPENFFDRLEKDGRVWAPWYTLHKIYAGLLDLYVLTGNEQALAVLRKAIDWVDARTGALSEEQMQRTLDVEHGGMNEVLAGLYMVTGEEKHLKLAQRFNHHAVLDPLIRGEDKLDGLHANTQFPKVIGLARQYELTGDENLRHGAEFFWQVVTRERSYVTGSDSDDEQFNPKKRLSTHLGPNTAETCNSYNMLKLTRHLFDWEPKAEYADYYERTLFNHILASIHPETGMTLYYLPLRSGMARGDARNGFAEPFGSFWCCTGTGVESHAKHGDSIFFHGDDLDLYVNLFIASELDWKSKGIRLRQETRFPDAPSTRLTFACTAPAALRLHIRRPSWAGEGFRVRVGGEEVPVTVEPGHFVTLRRTWKDGDTVDVNLPMTLHTEGFRDDPRRRALLYGPIVLCAPTKAGNEAAFALADQATVLQAVRPVEGVPLTFEGSAPVFRRNLGPAEGRTEFVPFFREFKRPYIVYWDLLSDAEWSKKEAAHREEAVRLERLKARTLDTLIFEGNAEKAHKLKGERSDAGEFGGRRWRHATDGGWFSYEMKVAGDKPVDLHCLYWGSDSGGREFDVFVDDVKIASQTLDRNAPDKFFEVIYPIPAALTSGKDKVTVRIHALEGKTAGGLFECRTLVRE